MNELRDDPLEATVDRRLDELSTEMRAGFARLEARIDLLRPPVWSATLSALDRFEKRITKRFFWYFMTQGIANAALILWMVKLLR